MRFLLTLALLGLMQAFVVNSIKVTDAIVVDKVFSTRITESFSKITFSSATSEGFVNALSYSIAQHDFVIQRSQLTKLLDRTNTKIEQSFLKEIKTPFSNRELKPSHHTLFKSLYRKHNLW